MNKVRNEEVCRSAGIEMELTSIAYQRVLRWIWQVERMNEYLMDRIVFTTEVSGERVLGRPRIDWMDRVKVALGSRGKTVEAAKKSAKVGHPPALWWRGVGCRYMMRLG